MSSLSKAMGMDARPFTASPYRRRQSGIATQYQSLANRGGAGVDEYDALFGDALRDRADYLREDPFTDSYSASALSGAAQGGADAYERSMSRLSANLNRRGIGGGIAAGAVGNIEARRAGTMAGAQNDLAQRKIAGLDARQQALIATLLQGRGIAAGERDRGMGGAASLYENLAGEDEQLNALNEQRRQQKRQAFLSLLASVGAVVGQGVRSPTKPDLSGLDFAGGSLIGAGMGGSF